MPLANLREFLQVRNVRGWIPFTLRLASLSAEAIPAATWINDGERRPICYR
jgi:hypothetical protein